MFKVLIVATLLAACDCMQQPSTGFQNPQGTFSYQKPFTAFSQPQQLAYQQPAPYQYPQPAYQQPQTLAYQQPQQQYLYQQPQPVYQQPEPVYQQPEPVYQQPQPVYQQPQPVYQQPQPAYQQLAYGYQQPALAPVAAQLQPLALAPASHAAMDDMMMMKDHDMMMMKEPALAAAPAPQPAPAAAPHEPMYLGTFDKARNKVEGDVFMLDERTLYIQGFSFDGQAPDVYFWSDGVAIPYYTRSNPQVQTVVGAYNKEDIVLLLPPEKPTVHDMGRFTIWCRQFDVTFGEFSMANMHHA